MTHIKNNFGATGEKRWLRNMKMVDGEGLEPTTYWV